MAIFQALFFFVLGAGLLWVDYRSLSSGYLPCGSNGFKGRLEFNKDRQPFGYWLMFVLYAGAGCWMLIFALQLLLGSANPLPLN